MGVRDISYETRIQPYKQRKIIVRKVAIRNKNIMLMLRMRITRQQQDIIYLRAKSFSSDQGCKYQNQKWWNHFRYRKMSFFVAPRCQICVALSVEQVHWTTRR